MDLQLVVVLVIIAVVSVVVFGQLKGSKSSYEVIGVEQLTAHQSKDDKKKEKVEKKVEQFHWDQAEKKEKRTTTPGDKKKKKKKETFDPVAAGQSMVVKPTTEEKKGIDVTTVPRKSKAKAEKLGFVTVESKSKRSVSKDIEEVEEAAPAEVEEYVDERVKMLQDIISGRQSSRENKDGSPTGGGGYKGKSGPKKTTTTDEADEGKKLSAIEKAILENKRIKEEKKNRYVTDAKKEFGTLKDKKFAATATAAPWGKPASPKAAEETKDEPEA